MAASKSTAPSPLVVAAAAFDASLSRFASLAQALARGALETRHDLASASDILTELAAGEEDLQARAQALVAALGVAREEQQAQAEQVRVRALEIQRRGQEYEAILERFRAIGQDAAELNALAQTFAGRRRIAEQTLRQDELPTLLSELDELDERMTAVAATSGVLATDARAARFDELHRNAESLRQQLLSARNRIGLLRETLGRAVPPDLIS